MGENTDLESKAKAVKDWLQRTGYRLEFQTNDTFRRAGFESTMGFFIESSGDDRKQREIDVTAVYKNKSLSFRVICECKYSGSIPWVMLNSGIVTQPIADWYSLPRSDNFPRIGDPLYRFNRACSEGKMHFSDGVPKASSHFSEGVQLAHSIVQAFSKRDNDDEKAIKADKKANQNNEKSKNRDFAYASLQKVATLSWDYAKLGVEDGSCPQIIIVPCLVVEAPLLSARFEQESGEFVVEPIKFGRIAWLGCRERTIVDVVQSDALAEYAGMARDTANILARFWDTDFAKQI